MMIIKVDDFEDHNFSWLSGKTLVGKSFHSTINCMFFDIILIHREVKAVKALVYVQIYSFFSLISGIQMDKIM